jgi:protein-tyrosine phosphatase
MIDIHCHMLPGIDDGPEQLDESLDMARMAVASGITEAVLTPHIHAGRYENTRASVQEATRRFQQCLQEHDIPLRLHMAGEIRIGPELMGMVEAQQVPWLGSLDGYRLILLELPHSHIPVGTDKLINWCLERRIRPVIPHPERNKDVIRDIEKIAPFVKQGCLLQVTAGSVAGNFGRMARMRAGQLLKRGWVSFLASDAHNTRHRIPNLEPGRASAADIIGEEAAWRLVRDNPRQILQAPVQDAVAGHNAAR